MQKLNNILLNNIWVKGEILKYFELNENENYLSKCVECTNSAKK